MVLPDSCYGSNGRFIDRFYIKNTKMCLHPQGVRIFNFYEYKLLKVLFRGDSSGAISRFMLRLKMAAL